VIVVISLHAAIKENSQEVPQKTKHRIADDIIFLLIGLCAQRTFSEHLIAISMLQF
jgi:hypothetical protein